MFVRAEMKQPFSHHGIRNYEQITWLNKYSKVSEY